MKNMPASVVKVIRGGGSVSKIFISSSKFLVKTQSGPINNDNNLSVNASVVSQSNVNN